MMKITRGKVEYRFADNWHVIFKMNGEMCGITKTRRKQRYIMHNK